MSVSGIVQNNNNHLIVYQLYHFQRKKIKSEAEAGRYGWKEDTESKP